MNFAWSLHDRIRVRFLFVFLSVCSLTLFGPLTPFASAASPGCLAAESGQPFTFNQAWAGVIIGQSFSAGEQFTVTFDSYANDNGNGPDVKEIYLGQGDGSGDANINAFAHFTLSSPGTFGPFTIPAGGISQLSMAVQWGAGTMNATGTVTCGLTPKVTSVTPSSGSAAGGTSVTITGLNFSDAYSVEFGGSDASFTVVNDTTITATTPAHAAGAVDVVVTTCYGTGTGSGGFTYAAHSPSVTAVNPPVGPAGGGNAVTISGANLTGATGVSIGGVAAPAFTVVNATTISATTPVHAAGAVDVAVTTAGGTATGAGIYTYIASPAVTAISPAGGPLAGGTTITVTGLNLAGVTALMIGGAAAPNVVVVNATTITARTPAHTAGTVDVTVSTTGGTGTGAGLYTYAAGPVVMSVTPSQGLVAGGTTVTITGSGLAGTTEVLVGGIAAAAVNVVDDRRITATTPAHAAGTVDVMLTTPGGTGSGAGLYRYYSALALTSTPSPVMRVGEPYSQINSARDGTPPYTYALLSGTMPEGLGLDPSTGGVSGTPAASGAFHYVIEVTDSSTPRLTATQTVTGTIAAIVTTVSVASSVNPTLIGEPTTLTAAITPAAASGAVTFRDGETTVCDAVPVSGGRAVCATPFTTAGLHSITAAYGGTSSYGAAVSTAFVQTVTDQRQKTADAIGTFLNRRNDLIAANEPDASRQIDRLIETDAPTQVASRRTERDAANSSLPRAAATAYTNQFETAIDRPNREVSPRGISLATGPMRVTADLNGPLHAEFATSLAQILRAAGGNAGSGLSRFDVAVEGNYGSFSSGRTGNDLDGRFGLISIGADYVLSRRLLIGTMLQLDTMRERSTAQASEANGHGWSLGPYATVRLSEHLFWQGRAAWGTSRNEVRPFLTYTDEFSTGRWLATSTLSGNWSAGRWIVRPAVSVSHLAESAANYHDTFGVEIPEITSRLGQARLGPEVRYVYRLHRAIRLEPRGGLELVSNFSGEATAAGVGAADGGVGRVGTRGRAEFGVRAVTSRGVGMDLSGTYDGIGAHDFGAFAGRLLVHVPMK